LPREERSLGSRAEVLDLHFVGRLARRADDGRIGCLVSCSCLACVVLLGEAFCRLFLQVFT
jgi:hypothetical protein